MGALYCAVALLLCLLFIGFCCNYLLLRSWPLCKLDCLFDCFFDILVTKEALTQLNTIPLPPPHIHTFIIHTQTYALHIESKTKFVCFVREGTLLNNYAHIFELLMRMRQAVNHPWLVTHRAESSKDVDICGICHEEAEDAVVSSCKHVFCREDIRLYLSSSYAASTACPVCLRPLSVDLTQPALPSR